MVLRQLSRTLKHLGKRPTRELPSPALRRHCWRKALEATLDGTRGCTHLRELLMNLGTMAYQTVGGKARRQEWEALPEPRIRPPVATSPKGPGQASAGTSPADKD